MLLRAALRKDWQASGSPESLDFEENRYGKPSLRGAARLQFNLSHSGDWCVCAVSESAVGIDVEQIRQQELDWADKLLADDEKAELLALTGYDRLKRFYEIWTLKESYVKALGRGLSHGLNTFSVTAASLGALAPYRAAGYWLDDSHPAAVCAMGGLPQRWAILSPFDIWSLLDHEIEAMRGECGE
jgi:4'-phosphopantetheinyl transferase